MAKAQGSLEYLIIIAVVLAVTAIVTLIAVNSFGSQQNRYFYTSCANAAAVCKTSLSANPSAQCSACDTSCVFSNGTEIFPRAITCCKQGKSDMIYDGSPGCMPACRDGTPYEECSENLPMYCDDAGNLVPNCNICPCPAGESCNTVTGTCYMPSDCGSVPNGQCSATKPLYCDNGVLVKRCDLCGCPSDSFRPCCDGMDACTCKWSYSCLSNGACDSYIEYTNCRTCSDCCLNGQCRNLANCPI